MSIKKSIWLFATLVIVVIMILTKSCKNEDDEQTHTVGQFFGGGIVFYVDNTGKHGLIAATSNQSVAPWGCEGTDIIGTTTAIGYGQANTTAIVNSCLTEGIAARICDQLVIDGFSDWFLPSKNELGLMHINLHLQGLGNFNTGAPYWSSSQVFSNSAYGWNFGNEVASDVGIFVTKNSAIYVRAIREF